VLQKHHRKNDNRHDKRSTQGAQKKTCLLPHSAILSRAPRNLRAATGDSHISIHAMLSLMSRPSPSSSNHPAIEWSPVPALTSRLALAER
jgi:hypothetical protein